MEEYEHLCLRVPPKDEVFDTNIPVSKREHVDFILSAKQELGIVITVSGVKWSYPGRSSMYHLYILEKEGKLKSMNVSPFLIDQEKDRIFCKQNGIMVGVPTLQSWFQSEPIYFTRNGWKTSNIVCGPFNYDEYLKIIKLINRAINNAQKTQSQLKEIDVDFLDDK
eukprot:UN04659